ncbi:phage tail tip lysozyme [Lentilactobacillus parabuchneri]|uniref:phage tail tip lysozyme n=1 Tax=Lentilactobacillus parabuchneri TaxID=152331 RepID=UPI000A10DD04|nr:phage tail tip lysozyme [Lentilactobacillus parabuchneri]ORN12733.1 putative endopeptidase p60 precursor [Lentilactobacillus parabuchneri]ORN14623.1 putative endopeptidase p60 precursor [Lentilactobacillus parabuchneri]ORN17538.1 putative endopeptidase p60 precursor [Lentilactobacillus parabuchneri]ORN23920.1 putative endopeptidase p60 precursor [Lentilactobacillus parabuchneri]
MAEAKEVRHAGIGLDLSINGLDDFKRANSMMDDFLETMKEASRITDKFKNNFSGFGGDTSREMNKARDSIKDVESQLDPVKSKINFSNEAKKDADAIHKVQDELRDLPTKKVTDIKTNFDNSNKSASNGSKLIKDYSDHVDKAHERVKRLHDIIFGSFVGTAVSNGIQNLASGIWNSAKNGFELAEAGERIERQWKTIGITSKQTEELDDQIGDIRSKADMSGGAINDMQKKIYALTNSVPITKTLVNEMAAYGSEAGKTGEQIQQMTGMVAKSLGSKKVSAGFFNRVFGQLPALRKQIQEASGMTNSAFNQALQNSKITGTEMQSWMIKAAKGSGSAWKAFGKTTAGQIAAIKGEWQNLEVAFAKPLSAGFAKGMDSMTGRNGGLKSARKELENIVKLLGTKVGDFAGKAVAFISQHHSDLNKIDTSLFSIVKNLAIGAWKPIATIIKTIGGQSGKASKDLRGFGDALNAISKHKSAIQSVGMVLAGMFAAKKLLDMGSGIWRLRKYILEFTSSTRLMGAAIKLLPWALWIAGITAAIVVLVKLYQHDKKFRKFVNGILSSAKKLASGTIKQFSNLWGDAKKIFGNGFKVIEKATNGFIDLITGHWGNLKKDLISYNKAMFKLIKSVFKGAFDYLNDLTGGKLGKMVDLFSDAWHSIGKGWKGFWNGIDDWFGNLWKSITKHVSNGINDVIKVLNAGIGGIDSVIHMFGGSSKAIGKIGYVHFANGTGVFGNQRHEITKPTLAMLNDGHDSPETGNREMLIHPNGMSELIKGTNVKRLLEPGAEILNASETKFAMSLNGMSHFAKGTGLLSNLWNGAKSIGSSVVGGVEKGFGAIGNFAGGILKATKKVFDTVKSIVKDPSKYLTGLLKKPSGKGTVLSDFANGFFGKMKSSATNWWKSLWGMVNLDGGSGGDATGLLAAVEKYGRGKRYVWGAAGPNTFDCSGLVMYALKHSFGIDYPHFSGAQYGKTKHISRSNAKPGDLVFWGPGKHVGVFAGGNKYWSAFAPNGHPDIGFHSISGSVPGYSPLFGEVKGLARKTVSKGKKSASNSIQSLIKKQVGSGFFKFMSKLANKFGDNGDMGSVGLAGDESQRAREIAKALKQAYPSATDAGIAGILGNWMQESRLSPSAIDSADHGTGLGQWTFGRETGLRNWEKKHGYAWNSAKGQLEYALHEPGESGAFKAVLRMTNPADAARKFFAGWESGGNEDATGGTRISNAEAAYKAIKGYAKGGRIQKNQLAKVHEDGWELFKPDTGGLMIPHEASEKIINGQNKKVSIDARTNLTIQGHADSSTINKIDERIEKRNNDLVEKMRQLLGSNDEGGLTV